VNHRHLLPSEIDLLLDGEAGFGVAPLQTHVRDCAECASRLEDARIIVDTLEALPHFAPSAALADRVMAQVPIFVPWHVAAREAVTGTVERWAPASRGARLAVAGAVTSVLAVLTIGMVWVAVQGDLLLVASGLAGDRLRTLVGGVVRDAAVAVFGEQMLIAVQQTGALGIALAMGGFVIAATGTVFGLRALAAGRRG
jgi:hypothetical protein